MDQNSIGATQSWTSTNRSRPHAGKHCAKQPAPITLHISASLSADNVSYDLASVDADLPITVEVVNNNGTIMPKVDSVGFTRILTAGINAFTNAIKA